MDGSKSRLKLSHVVLHNFVQIRISTLTVYPGMKKVKRGTPGL